MCIFSPVCFVTVSIAPSVPVENTDVVLSCNVSPWPKEATIRWRLNGEPVGPRESQINDTEVTPVQNVAVPQRVLRVRASQSLAGNWTCVVSTGNNRGEATQHLSVTGENSKESRIHFRYRLLQITFWGMLVIYIGNRR